MEGDNNYKESRDTHEHDFSVLEGLFMFMFPGFKFSPSDQELILYYLKKKTEGCENNVEVIAEVDICGHEPPLGPARGKKRPGGSKKRRAAELGYWKATGREHDVRSGTDVIGTKRNLVYHLGRGTKGTRMVWMMNEYSANVKDQNSLVVCHLRKSPMSRGHETSDKTSLSQRPMSANGSNVASVVLEQFAVAEAQSKKFSSSYDSRSVGKTDSDGQCKPKPKLSKAESSTRQKDMDAGEDFYEEILKDEIVNLDEHFISTNPGTLHNIPGSPEGERKSQELMEAMLPSILPFHGTASRRMRLRKQMPRNTKASALRILRMNKKLNTRDKKGQWQQGT